MIYGEEARGGEENVNASGTCRRRAWQLQRLRRHMLDIGLLVMKFAAFVGVSTRCSK